jgi:hypothetical protein
VTSSERAQARSLKGGSCAHVAAQRGAQVARCTAAIVLQRSCSDLGAIWNPTVIFQIRDRHGAERRYACRAPFRSHRRFHGCGQSAMIERGRLSAVEAEILSGARLAC